MEQRLRGGIYHVGEVEGVRAFTGTEATIHLFRLFHSTDTIIDFHPSFLLSSFSSVSHTQTPLGVHVLEPQLWRYQCAAHPISHVLHASVYKENREHLLLMPPGFLHAQA